MQVLIRKTPGPHRSDAVYTDGALDVKRIQVGSAPGCDLQLAGIAAEHCTVQSSGNSARLNCSRGNTVVYNGETVSKCDLKVGDTVMVGGNRLASVEAPAGFDLALQVSVENTEGVELEGGYQTDLRQTWLPSRLVAWVLCVGVLIATCALPLWHHFGDRNDPGERSFLDISMLTDQVWSSGPLHAAHASLEQDCRACHTKLFQQVTNDSCEVCHSDTVDHIASVAANEHLPIDMNGRCASCHKEHNEPQSTLILDGDTVCSDCHAEHDLKSDADTEMPRVATFAEDAHPPFRATLLTPTPFTEDELQQWHTERTLVTEATENSQLIFNHLAHYQESQVALLKDGVMTPLGCIDCHQPASDGEHFEPVTFEQNCATSGCHDLELDARNRLPHALPDVAIAAMQGYYLRTIGDSVEAANALVDACRRRPGRNNCEKKCTGTPFECASERAERKIHQQFADSGCVTCHLIEDLPDRELQDRYQVASVKLVTDFMPHARFDHTSHGIIIEPGTNNTLTEDEACSYCHAAAESEQSSDLLLPDINSCTICHGTTEPVASVPLQCSDCHAYHPRGINVGHNALTEN